MHALFAMIRLISYLCAALSIVLFNSCNKPRIVPIPGTNFSIQLDPDGKGNSAYFYFNDKHSVDTISWSSFRALREGGIYIYVLDDDHWIVLENYEIKDKTMKYTERNVSIDWRDRLWGNEFLHHDAIDYYGYILPYLTDSDLPFKTIISLDINTIWVQSSHDTLPYLLYDKRLIKRIDNRLYNRKDLQQQLKDDRLGMTFELYMDNQYHYLLVKDSCGTVKDEFKWIFSPAPLFIKYNDGIYFIESRSLTERHPAFMEHCGQSSVKYVPNYKWSWDDDGLCPGVQNKDCIGLIIETNRFHRMVR